LDNWLGLGVCNDWGLPPLSCTGVLGGAVGKPASSGKWPFQQSRERNAMGTLFCIA